MIACIGLHLLTTVKPVLSGHSKIGKTKVLKTDGSLMQVSKIGKTKVLKTDGSLMQVESIAECSLGDLH